MNANEPLSTRAARMKDYNELIQQLDSGGARYSQDLSEVDLSDSEDVKIVTTDPNGEVLVHLGNGNYLQRYKIYVTRVEAWRQQFSKLDSVDLRYDGQIIVNPDVQGLARQPALTPAAAKAALAAGVKTAAIVNYEKYLTHPAPFIGPKPAPPKAKAGAKPAAKVASKPAPKKATAKAGAKAPVHRAARKAKARVAIAKKSAPLQVHAAPKPAASASAPNTTVAGAQKKPSAAIQKETPQN
jgi:cell division protein FtsQ